MDSCVLGGPVGGWKLRSFLYHHLDTEPWEKFSQEWIFFLPSKRIWRQKAEDTKTLSLLPVYSLLWILASILKVALCARQLLGCQICESKQEAGRRRKRQKDYAPAVCPFKESS